MFCCVADTHTGFSGALGIGRTNRSCVGEIDASRMTPAGSLAEGHAFTMFMVVRTVFCHCRSSLEALCRTHKKVEKVLRLVDQSGRGSLYVLFLLFCLTS